MCNNRRRHKNMRRAEKRAQKRKEKERLINAEKQELLNKDDVVLSGEDKKLQSDKLTSFEVYVRWYNKVGRVHPETDDDASSLDVDNFSYDNHPDHVDKPHQNPTKKVKIVKAIVDD